MGFVLLQCLWLSVARQPLTIQRMYFYCISTFLLRKTRHRNRHNISDRTPGPAVQNPSSGSFCQPYYCGLLSPHTPPSPFWCRCTRFIDCCPPKLYRRPSLYDSHWQSFNSRHPRLRIALPHSRPRNLGRRYAKGHSAHYAMVRRAAHSRSASSVRA
jgi:hypothetical protein